MTSRHAPAPRYDNLTPASVKASSAARGSSRKTDTKPEVVLRRALWQAGLRYRKNVSELPGKPDLVFKGARVVVFCDGDFWHGKDWGARKKKLLRGTNSDYWIAKIERNIKHDEEQTRRLEREGWLVLRVWESEVLNEPSEVVTSIVAAVKSRRSTST